MILHEFPQTERVQTPNTHTVNVEPHNVGRMTKICQFCLAKLWSTETSSLCCANGQVILPPLQPLPVELHQLFVGGSSEAKDFRQHIRGYNASFAFASLGVHEDVLPAGVYSFRINVVYKSALLN